MITNQRQFDLTRTQVAKFERALAELVREQETSDLHPLLLKAQRESISAQMDELRSALLAYEQLQAGERTVLELDSLDDLPSALISARIAARLNHRELAERLGLKEQQIQRYEATQYAGASLSRIHQIAQALGLAIRKDVFLPTGKLTVRGILQSLRKLGIDGGFLRDRVLPPGLAAHLSGRHSKEEEPRIALAIAGMVERVFGIRPVALFGDAPLRLASAATGGVRYKVPANINETKLTAYTVYAHYLALLVLRATDELIAQPIPTDPLQLRAEVIERAGEFTFKAVLDYVWSRGVPVLPLRDPGAFHGACWRVDGRNVIVLKQVTSSEARWLYDLLHEFRHAAEDPERDNLAVIELGESAVDWKAAPEEVEAMEFAGSAILDGRADELAERCADEALGSIQALKWVVPDVAQDEGVSVGALANYLALRLSQQGQSWWSTASTLQEEASDPYETARDALLKRLNWARLNEPDQQLLVRALASVEEVRDEQ
jgi:transcriptional regulator with XRE-family HTH domain